MESDSVADVVEGWRNLNFSSIKRKLSLLSSLAKENESKNSESRKELVRKTKSLKDKSTEASGNSLKLSDVSEVLKSFQVEVDILTKRSRATETFIQSLDERFSPLRDPSQMLIDFDSEIVSLEGKLSKANEEASANESYIRGLEEKLLEKEEKISSLQNETRNQGAAEFLDNVKEEYEEKVRDIAFTSEERVAQMRAQLDFAQEEAQQLRLKVSQLEAAQRVQGGGQSVSENVDRLERESFDLSMKLKQAELEKKQLIERHEKSESELKLKLKSFEAKQGETGEYNQRLKKDLDDASNLIRLKEEEMGKLNKRVSIISKSLGLSEDEGEEVFQLSSVEEALNKTLLLTKTELEQQKKEKRDLEAKISQQEAIERSLRENIKDQESRQKSIESEIFKMSSLDKAKESKEHSVIDGSNANASADIFLMAVTSQRDRLRIRAQEYEEELDQKKTQIGYLEKHISDLSSQNSKLHQRIRFLQNYKQSEKSTLLAKYTEYQGRDLDEAEKGGGFSPGSLGHGVEHKFRNIFEGNADGDWDQSRTSNSGGIGAPIADTLFKNIHKLSTTGRGRQYFSYYVIFVHVSWVLLLFLAV